MMHLEAIIERNRGYQQEYVEEPVALPVGYVETLPCRDRKARKKLPKPDVVKIGWGSERVNRRRRNV